MEIKIGNITLGEWYHSYDGADHWFRTSWDYVEYVEISSNTVIDYQTEYNVYFLGNIFGSLNTLYKGKLFYSLEDCKGHVDNSLLKLAKLAHFT